MDANSSPKRPPGEPKALLDEDIGPVLARLDAWYAAHLPPDRYKFNPPATWMYIAGAIETVLCIGLFFGIYLQYVAFIAFIHLLVAATATYKVTKSWIWVIGGIEYCVFWAICCLVVAMHAFHAGI